MRVCAAKSRLDAAFGAFRVRHVLITMLLALSGSAAHALDKEYGALSDQLAEMIATAHALAVADDTYEFVSRPNLPYVFEHYSKERLAADRIDTVLIINAHGKPLFWRRAKPGPNRGFPDARAFLAELPVLPVPGASGVPGIAEPALLDTGPALVVAMPIYRAAGTGRARGWLIAARTLAGAPGHPLRGLARVPVRTFNPCAVALAKCVVMERQIAGITASAAFFTAPSVLWITLLIIITGVVLVKSGVWSMHPVGGTAVPSRPGGIGGTDIKLTVYPTNRLAVAPSSRRLSAGQSRDSLQARITAANAVFRYQPQVDLQTGRVAGVEALLCVPGPSGYRPAVELAVEIEEAGFGLALIEHRLQEACREQRTWLRYVGHDFAIGVPVSQRMLVDAAFLPLVERVLADHQLAPSSLELEVEETALGACAPALRALCKVHEAGISIAVDGFNANHSNLRLLAILPIAKLRIDPWLLLRMGDRVSEAQLFAGILGAAKGLRITVCATGVASADLLAAVIKHGRPLAQGAALGMPLEGPDFLELLRGSKVDTVTLRTLELEWVPAHPEPA
jgi:EAL domain-containing protein (putative c-di-GMP-specific phosphodiesterase class I)